MAGSIHRACRKARPGTLQLSAAALRRITQHPEPGSRSPQCSAPAGKLRTSTRAVPSGAYLPGTASSYPFCPSTPRSQCGWAHPREARARLLPPPPPHRQAHRAAQLVRRSTASALPSAASALLPLSCKCGLHLAQAISRRPLTPDPPLPTTPHHTRRCDVCLIAPPFAPPTVPQDPNFGGLMFQLRVEDAKRRLGGAGRLVPSAGGEGAG